jgi:mono/diheme cytochrome c family protein
MYQLLIYFTLLCFSAICLGHGAAFAQMTPAVSPTEEDSHRVEIKGDPERGRNLILNKMYLPRDFHQSVLDEVWRDWPEPLQSQAAKADLAERRQMTFARYGFSSRENNPDLPKQFTVDSDGWYSMNCFACHGGQVAGKSIDGVPNSSIALETLYEDMRKTKQRMNVAFSGMDVGSLAMPMGTSNGTSNAVMFGVALMGFRNPDLSHKLLPKRPKMTHHDMDAPAWWNVKYRDRIYIDGFVEKNHRALLPFVMDARTSGETIKSWETEFQDIYAFIHSLESPKYPFAIDQSLAFQGKRVFESNCSKCHGTYGPTPTYPGVVVDIDDIKTDSVRFEGFTVYDREVYRDSWYADFGADETIVEPRGYLAPPLHGIWASAPYFHNGSVPTLFHVLNPQTRPVVWKRDGNQYDTENVGLKFIPFDRVPAGAVRSDQRREYFNSNKAGKSRLGHDYPDRLSQAEKKALLEYLKTL